MVDVPHSLAPTSESPSHGSRRPVLQATALLVLLGPAAIGLAWLLAWQFGATLPMAAASMTAGVFAFGAVAVLMGLRQGAQFPHLSLGWCNSVTLLRGAGIAVMAGLVLAPDADFGWGLVLIAGLLLALDGVDGWLARREGMQSNFGARFDVESDVAFALTLAALAVAQGQAGPWFLALGLLRPLFLAGGRIWPALRAPLPDARWRKQMAGLQMSVQVALVAPVLAPPATSAIAAALLAAMVLSFMVDIRWLLRQKPAA